MPYLLYIDICHSLLFSLSSPSSTLPTLVTFLKKKPLIQSLPNVYLIKLEFPSLAERPCLNLSLQLHLPLALFLLFSPLPPFITEISMLQLQKIPYYSSNIPGPFLTNSLTLNKHVVSFAQNNFPLIPDFSVAPSRK